MKIITAYNIDNIKLLHGDFSKSESWDDMIMNGGSFVKDNQYMTFDNNGSEVTVGFELSVIGTHTYDPGDYDTPPYSDCDISDVNILIDYLTIDDESIDTNKETNDVLVNLINKNL